MRLREKALAAKVKQAERTRAAVAPYLQPDEQIVVSAMAMRAPSFWFIVFLRLGLWVKTYFVALTDRRLILVRASFTGQKALGLYLAHAREEVSVRSVKDGFPWLTVRLVLPGGRRLRLRFGKGKKAWSNGYRDEAITICNALGETPASGLKMAG